MLYSVVLGNQEIIKNDWALITDEFGNTYISNDDIRQRIKLGNKVNPKLDLVYSSAFSCCYNMPENTIISNGNRNMNLSLINYWSKDKNEMEKHVDDSILYITLMNENYKLICYNSEAGDIVQTFKKKDVYQGFAIRFKDTNMVNVSLSIEMKDIKMNRYVVIDIKIDEEGKIDVQKTPIENKKEISKMKALLKKIGNKLAHFKIDFKDNNFITAVTLVHPDYIEEMNQYTDGIKNAVLIEVDPIVFEKNAPEDLVKEYDRIFEEQIVTPKVKAITTVGVKLPYEFCTKYKILYLFSFDVETKKLKCLRSN